MSLRKLRLSDQSRFTKWWRDTELIKLTSGVLEPISDKMVAKYFTTMLKDERDLNFMITVDGKTVGHVALMHRPRGWYETQIVIGEKSAWGKGYGTLAIKSLLQRAKRKRIKKIYLEVRPDNSRAIGAYRKCGFVGGVVFKHPGSKSLPATLRMELG